MADDTQETQETRSPLPRYNAVVSSAQVIPAKRKFTPNYDKWQDELWDYYDRLGEFESGVSWLANTMSRVRLIAAELVPGGDEPVPITEGPAADAVMRLAGGTGGQAQLLKEMTIHLSVPGEGWLVGEGADLDEKWQVYSADELKITSRNEYQVREGEDSKSVRGLGPESVVVRFWDPHPRFGWQADSAARHAMGAMLELDLINKRIIAEVISRLASNGILLYDKGKLSFPGAKSASGDPEGASKSDPFAEILVDVASRGISDPTSPEATIPIPIGFDLNDLTDVDPASLLRWITVSNHLDPKLLEERSEAVKRLATSLDMPAEVLLGMAGINHWGAWQIEESGIKIHVAPKAELITFSLTTGYLVPSLKAMNESLLGPNGGRIVVWYDPSEIVVRPDRSSNVMAAYDRLEVSGRVLRREIGLSEEGDAPTKEELRDMITKIIAKNPQQAFAILSQLGGPDISGQLAPAPETGDGEGEEQDDDSPDEGDRSGTPDTREDPPPAPGSDGPPDATAASAMPVPGGAGYPEQLAVVRALNNLPVDVRAKVINDAAELLYGDVPPASQWFEAHEPNDARVTPKTRRNNERIGEELPA